MKKAISCRYDTWATTPKRKNQSHLADFFGNYFQAKKEEGTESTDCKSGGFKHKIFKWQHSNQSLLF
jgi:hypothetical protein